MGNCLAPGPGAVKQRRGADAQRLKAWRATGIVTLPPGSKEVPQAVTSELGPSVKVLDGGGAALTQLPDEIGCLVNLTRLAVPNNQIPSLPPGLGALTSLRALVLDANRLTTLPAAPGFWSGLGRLEQLSLSDNQISNLPPAIQALTSLKVLAAARNDLIAIPWELGGCAALESLDVSGNPRLAVIPDGLARLARLKSLLADGTAVAAVPPAVLRGCAALQTLSLHGCPITAERLQATDGFEEFEARRRGRFTKIIAGGVAPSKGLDEGVDRELKPGGPSPPPPPG